MNGDFSLSGAIAGVIFTTLGVLFLLDAIDAIVLDLGVVLPIALVALGVAVIASAILRRPAHLREE